VNDCLTTDDLAANITSDSIADGNQHALIIQTNHLEIHYASSSFNQGTIILNVANSCWHCSI